MARTVAVALLVLLGVICSVDAQLLGGRSPAPTAPRAAGSAAPNSPIAVICGRPDLTQFCALLQAAISDPVVSQLNSPNFVGTIFAPTDKGLQATNSRIKSNLGVGVEGLSRNPQDAANLIKNHIIVGQALSSPQLTNDLKLKTAYGDTVEIDKGFLWGTYVKGQRNTVSLTGDKDILAGQAYIHEVDGAIVPRVKGSGGLFGK